jgi:hypothetical protein
MRYVAINRPNEFSGSLWNFDIDGVELKKDHKDLLFHKVFPLLQSGGSAAILGLASLTGSEEHDLELSVRRAEAVAKYMHALWDWTPTDPLKFYGGPMRLGKPRASGKAVADAYYESHKGKRGNLRENDFFRAVWVHVWDKPSPPSEEVIVPAITMPDLPLTNDQIEFGKWLTSSLGSKARHPSRNYCHHWILRSRSLTRSLRYPRHGPPEIRGHSLTATLSPTTEPCRTWPMLTVTPFSTACRTPDGRRFRCHRSTKKCGPHRRLPFRIRGTKAKRPDARPPTKASSGSKRIPFGWTLGCAAT